MKKWALVLGGGGAKGAYHLGVWQALCEMNIEVDFICGTSIGAINAAMICQGSFEELQSVWGNITIEEVVDLSDIDILGQKLFDIKNLKNVAEKALGSGLEMSPLRAILDEYIDEERVRTSDMEFALVTCRASDLEEIALTKADIPHGRLVDYLMASASIPGFKPAVIDGEAYYDGGVRNNLAFDIPVEQGKKDIIIVDIGGPGVVKPRNFVGINAVEIKVSENVIGLMEFTPEAIEKAIKMGYYDCYKTFSRLEGSIYNFNIGDYKRARLLYSANILEGIEIAGEILGIDKFKVYSIESFINGVVTLFEKAQNSGSANDDVKNLIRITEEILAGNEDKFTNKIKSGFAGEAKKGAYALVYFKNYKKM